MTEEMSRAKGFWEKPHKFEANTFQGREQLACKVCGYLEVADIHVLPPEPKGEDAPVGVVTDCNQLKYLIDPKQPHKFVVSGVTAGNTGIALCGMCGASERLALHHEPAPEAAGPEAVRVFDDALHNASLTCDCKKRGKFPCSGCQSAWHQAWDLAEVKIKRVSEPATEAVPEAIRDAKKELLKAYRDTHEVSEYACDSGAIYARDMRCELCKKYDSMSKPEPATEGEFEEWWDKAVTAEAFKSLKHVAQAAWNAARAR